MKNFMNPTLEKLAAAKELEKVFSAGRSNIILEI